MCQNIMKQVKSKFDMTITATKITTKTESLILEAALYKIRKKIYNKFKNKSYENSSHKSIPTFNTNTPYILMMIMIIRTMAKMTSIIRIMANLKKSIKLPKTKRKRNKTQNSKIKKGSFDSCLTSSSSHFQSIKENIKKTKFISGNSLYFYNFNFYDLDDINFREKSNSHNILYLIFKSYKINDLLETITAKLVSFSLTFLIFFTLNGVKFRNNLIAAKPLNSSITKCSFESSMLMNKLSHYHNYLILFNCNHYRIQANHLSFSLAFPSMKVTFIILFLMNIYYKYFYQNFYHSRKSFRRKSKLPQHLPSSFPKTFSSIICMAL